MRVFVAHPGAELYGADRMLLESVRGFLEQGWPTLVTVSVPGPLVARLEEAGAEVQVRAAPIIRKSKANARGVRELGGELARTARSNLAALHGFAPDVVYVSTVTTPSWLLLARLARKPVVCHVHEAEQSVARVQRRGVSAPVLLAHRVIANSTFSLDVLLEDYPLLRRRSTVVYNAVTGPPTVVPARAEVSGDLRLVYVGRISERKGVLDLAAALPLLAERGLNVRLDIVGDVFPGYESVKRELVDLLATHGLEERVTLHGFVPDVWPFLAAADVAVVPSRLDEPFGNTAVEAALAARPLVVSSTAGLREAVRGLRSARPSIPGSAASIAAEVAVIATGWSRYRDAAVLDAQDTARRYSPERYRAEVRHVLESAVVR